MPNKRSIVVGETNYLWQVYGAGIRVWLPGGRFLDASVKDVAGVVMDDFDRGREDGNSDGMIRPFHVANWIRVNIRGEAPLSFGAKAEPGAQNQGRPNTTLVPAPASQPEIYLIEADCFDDDAYRTLYRPIEAHLDPAVARQRIADLDKTQAEYAALGKELHDLFMETDVETVDWDDVKAGFFARHGIDDLAIRHRIVDAQTQDIKYRIKVIPLIGSARVPA